MGKERTIQVLIVDDHTLVRRGIRSILEDYSDIHIVGEASDGLEAIHLVEKHAPCVVLMDINMPRMGGVEASAQIMSRYADTIIIGLSMDATMENQEAMQRTGAVRLISKEVAGERLYEMIHETVKSRETPSN